MYKFDSAGPFANVSLGTTIATLYTVPTGKILQITAILLVNTGNTQEDVELWANANDNTHILVPRLTLAVGVRKVIRTQMTLQAASTIQGKTFINGSYAGIVFNLHGILLVN